MRNLYILFSLFFVLSSCKYDKGELPNVSGYPDDVAKIVVTKCATNGCHNDASRDAASGLSLSTWERLFEGTRNGTAVIPYRPDQSTMMFFTNTFSDLGPSINPIMPLGGSPLTRTELEVLRSWIARGAPNQDGNIAFASNSNRRKMYLTNQGCDLVAVIDATTGKIMRYISVGTKASIESPHMVKVSPDGQFWYVVFLGGDVIQKFRTSDDSFVGNILIGGGNWNTLAITNDSKKAVAVDWTINGKVTVVDLENMVKITDIQGLKWPHGSYFDNTGNIVYITTQTGNYINKLDISNINLPQVEQIVLQAGMPALDISWFDPHEVILNSSGTRLYVTCQKTNQVKVINTANDQVIATINVGIYPQEMAISESKNLLFVSCPEDTASFAGKRGSVSIIDMNTNAVVKNVFTGYQPHGIISDELNGYVYVANRNATSDGPAPHHSTECAGRNGYVTRISLNTLTLDTKYKHEVTVDPYSFAIRP